MMNNGWIKSSWSSTEFYYPCVQRDWDFVLIILVREYGDDMWYDDDGETSILNKK